ncbi:polygalacturonase [Mycena metata]|uniref:endo-polygalacturonase n=1 Tax=Mycena metata TaxID=1033252 RepID=A0AAD7JH19_9AGAR|nr:polygalacturonase [Mycena metata]
MVDETAETPPKLRTAVSQHLTLGHANTATAGTARHGATRLFPGAQWAGPLMLVSGQNVTFNGNGHTLFGQGDLYWCIVLPPYSPSPSPPQLGGNGGVTKPAPFIRVNNAGSFSNVRILNAPERSVAVKGSQVTISGIMIDNSLGDLPNSRSNGLPAGHNTDGFGISNANNVIIQNSSVHNQDDCLAVNGGTNITFQNNVCVGGHGISIGSIASNVVVNNVHITENTVMNNTNGLRIKIDATATASTVSDIVYTDNKLSGITETPSQSPPWQSATWSFAALTVTGGAAGTIRDAPVTGGLF